MDEQRANKPQLVGGRHRSCPVRCPRLPIRIPRLPNTFVSRTFGLAISATLGPSRCRDSLIKSRSLPSWEEAWSAAGLTSASGAWCRGKASVPWLRQRRPTPAPKPGDRAGIGPSCPGAVRSSDLACAQTAQTPGTRKWSSQTTRMLLRLLGKSLQLKPSPCAAPHFSCGACSRLRFNAFLLLWSVLPRAQHSSAQGPGFGS